MCMLIDSIGVTQRQTSLTSPSPALATKLPTASAYQTRSLCAQQASLTHRITQVLYRGTARGVELRCLTETQSAVSSQTGHSSCLASFCIANSKHQSDLSGLWNATAIHAARLAEACNLQQHQAACLAGLISTVAALLLIPGTACASEACQVISRFHMQSITGSSAWLHNGMHLHCRLSPITLTIMPLSLVQKATALPMLLTCQAALLSRVTL